MTMSRAPLAQTGFVLIEVMISVVIFAIGVIALVGLQFAMTRAQTESKVRADAANLAGELIGIIWADSANLAGYNGTGCASTPQCANWTSKVALTLPSGTPTISANATSGLVSLTLRWTPPGSSTHTYETSTLVVRNPP
jgi:type IV pilus assembly protein PilV